MIPEIGHFALILALCVALVQSVLPVVGAARNIPGWIAVARPAAYTQLLFVAIAYICLTYAFITNDFSVAYTATNSNSRLPLLYKISAVWGAHEGSLLLWGLVLAVWTGAVARFSRSVPEAMLARVVGVMGMISVGFLLFMLFTSNPFARLIPAAMEGRDLNPLLQDVGLAIHPPMLYLGYVGFSVPFAFAVAALLHGRLDPAWARWSRPWTNMAWLFLTLGISLGSWWAYYELGWGGWWFWDPVENASFMPWLVGTALIHSLAATEKRGIFKAWTALLAVFAFSLSLLGTFLVRSGVLTSVHAFATDPARGIFILAFLGIVIGGSLALYAWRAPSIRSTTSFELVSREAGLLLNNVLLVVVAATVLLGTLYPLILDALGVGKISVGPPYFNAVFIPLTIPLAVAMGVGAMARWKKDQFTRLMRPLWWVLAVSILAGIFLPMAMGGFDWRAAVGAMLAFWVILTTMEALRERVRNKPDKFKALASIPSGFYGMICGHLGIAIFIVGITMVSVYELEKDLPLAPGDSFVLGDYEFRFDDVSRVPGPNYTATVGTITVSKDARVVTVLTPEKRSYPTQAQSMTEAAIDAGLFRDLYVSLGEPLDERNTWSVRLYYKPFIRWIWLGTIFMALGGLLGALDPRYRMARRLAADRRRAPPGVAAETV
ncbi:heme lyase CcmF/NrfE family subunit [Gammaproteobacteria bacterium]|nr:heme lyase CcmF/NrfE family subunit [Gammaproteobacteria bacterium]